MIATGKTKHIFVQLSLDITANVNATITSADFYFDPDGSGSSKKYSSNQPIVTVEPSNTDYISVVIDP